MRFVGQTHHGLPLPTFTSVNDFLQLRNCGYKQASSFCNCKFVPHLFMLFCHTRSPQFNVLVPENARWINVDHIS